MERRCATHGDGKRDGIDAADALWAGYCGEEVEPICGREQSGWGARAQVPEDKVATGPGENIRGKA